MGPEEHLSGAIKGIRIMPWSFLDSGSMELACKHTV